MINAWMRVIIWYRELWAALLYYCRTGFHKDVVIIAKIMTTNHCYHYMECHREYAHYTCIGVVFSFLAFAIITVLIPWWIWRKRQHVCWYRIPFYSIACPTLPIDLHLYRVCGNWWVSSVLRDLSSLCSQLSPFQGEVTSFEWGEAGRGGQYEILRVCLPDSAIVRLVSPLHQPQLLSASTSVPHLWHSQCDSLLLFLSPCFRLVGTIR